MINFKKVARVSVLVLSLLACAGIVLAYYFYSGIVNQSICSPRTVFFSPMVRSAAGDREWLKISASDAENKIGGIVITQIPNQEPVDEENFWIDADDTGSVLQYPPVTVAVSSTVNTLEFNVGGVGVCNSDTVVAIDPEDIHVRFFFNDDPQLSDQVMLQYSGHKKDIVLLDVSWRNKFHTQWEMQVDWEDR